MEFQSSDLIEKIAKLKRKPVQVTGYLLVDGEDGSLRLYPQLDPERYFVVPKNCVLETVTEPGNEKGRVTLLLDADCEVQSVTKESQRASEIDVRKCDKSPCACTPPVIPPDVVYMDTSWVIRHAQMLLSFGVNQLDCGVWVRAGGSGGAGCCQAWNRLLSDLASGGNGISAAEYVIAGCALK